jgi:fructose-1,6-bisphosphatase
VTRLRCRCVCGGPAGKGVHRFVLDPSYGEFIYVGAMNVPEGGGKQIYSCNEGNSNFWCALEQYLYTAGAAAS